MSLKEKIAKKIKNDNTLPRNAEERERLIREIDTFIDQNPDVLPEEHFVIAVDRFEKSSPGIGRQTLQYLS